MNGRGQHQGGWVATFVIVGAVLVLALLGSVYYVKTRHDAAQNSDHSQSTTTDSSDKKTDKNDKKAPAKQPVDKPASSDTPPADQPSTKPDEATSDKDTQPAAHPLPQTGPADTLSSVIVLSLLAFTIVSFVRSRRALALTSVDH